MNHGNRLRKLLVTLYIEKQELAKRLNVSPSNISHYLKEHTFSQARIEKVCTALGITAEQFLNEDAQILKEPESFYYSENARIDLLEQIIKEKERLIQILLKNQKD
ncbi:XRE family transcriptional regulator [Sphingobacteriales bacterium UPWRP_1]|nr:hypothetical protein B6N25_14485 [Sphingobacteriales bacterium TSM_CSS]PSJ78910.1 XRE family transcriptional regulator [Sphingobacteriales bacterium UPWRP_1]